MTLQFKADTNVDLDERSRVRVRVWGFDQYVADAPATNLRDEVFDLPSLEVEPSVSFTEEELLQVYPFSGDDEGLGYYVTFAIDTDGDDRVCVGDYRRDYDRTETPFFTKEDDGPRSVGIFITEITDRIECEDF